MKIILSTILLILSTCIASAQPVRIAYVGEGIHNAPLYIAQKYNWFGSNIDIKVERYSDFNMIVQNLSWKNLETTFIATTLSIINAKRVGMPIGIARVVVKEFPGALIANKPYTSLKGLRIAYAGPTPEQIVYMEPLLKKYNTSLADFQTIFANSTPVRFSILMSNNADAVLLNPPLENKALNTGRFFNLGYISDFKTELPWAMMAFNKEWAEQNKTIVSELVAIYDKTIDYFYNPQNREKIIDLFVQRIKISREEATKGYEVYFNNNYFGRNNIIPKEKIQELITKYKKYEKSDFVIDIDSFAISGISYVK